MQYSQEHLKTMVYAEFGGQTECIMGNWKIENTEYSRYVFFFHFSEVNIRQRFITIGVGSGIMNHSNKTCKNHEFLF